MAEWFDDIETHMKLPTAEIKDDMANASALRLHNIRPEGERILKKYEDRLSKTPRRPPQSINGRGIVPQILHALAQAEKRVADAKKWLACLVSAISERGPVAMEEARAQANGEALTLATRVGRVVGKGLAKIAWVVVVAAISAVVTLWLSR